MRTDIQLSSRKQGLLGIVGHVGVGHAHSVGSIVQDDSAGFVVAGSLIRQALNVSARIVSAAADPDTGYVSVKTEGGGTGRAFARRGFTPFEAELCERAVGCDALFPQAAAMKAMGRVYGQGAGEAASALEAACALAVFDTFAAVSGGKAVLTDCQLPGRLDSVLGTVIEIDGIPVSVMMVLNATEGGIGPDEDYEGNTPLGLKGEAMRELGLTELPSIIIESKLYRPDLCDPLQTARMMVRAQKGVDHEHVAVALCRAMEKEGIPHICLFDAMPLGSGNLRSATRKAGEHIKTLAEQLCAAETSFEKVRLAAELNRFVSEELGGVTFMSNDLNDEVRGAGLKPHTGAVLSMLVPKTEYQVWKIPIMTEDDRVMYQKSVIGAVHEFAAR